MTSSPLSAEELKLAGNKSFAESNFEEALSYYRKAIETDPEVAVYYSNAATCASRLGRPLDALVLINEAIRLDPAFVKALYRRGVCLTELGRWKEASEDFIRVCREFPSDVEAQRRLKACDEHLATARKSLSFEESFRRQFNAAIHAERFMLTQKCIEALDVDASYSGPRLGFEEAVSVEWVKDELLPFFAADQKLPVKFAYALLLRAKQVFEQEPSLVEVSLEGLEEEPVALTICGDIHGQFFDLLEVFRQNGYPSARHGYLFNGDIVDRGPYSVECLLTMCAFKIALPGAFFVSRGNHESEPINRVHGFHDECLRKYHDKSPEFFGLANQMLNALPIAYVVGKELFVVHGGLPGGADFSLDDVRRLQRFQVPESGSLLSQLLWSDPQTQQGTVPSHRGEGVLFGPDVTAAFLLRNGLKRIVRSHEWQAEGFVCEHGGLCVTIFSAPNYTGASSPAAYINVRVRSGPGLDSSDRLELLFEQFSAAKYQGRAAKPRPSVPISGTWY